MKLSKADIAYWDQAVELTAGGTREVCADCSHERYQHKKRKGCQALMAYDLRCLHTEFVAEGAR